MKALSYEARIKKPDAEKINLIVSSVISEFIHAEAHKPDGLILQSYRAKSMAREIKRRICQLILVEVDLIISFSNGVDGTPSPVALSNVHTSMPSSIPPAHYAMEWWQQGIQLPADDMFRGSLLSPI